MRILLSTLFVLILCFQGPALAQEGFPLDGTWRGEWGRPGGDMTLVVMVMQWDGSSINGIINPGRNSVPIDNATLDATDWRVHIEAVSGEGEPFVIDATLENIGSYTRTITGTWTMAGTEYAFQMTRE
ncbi:MAG: hypothetical protein WD601_13975 [Pseudohongiellaceae bacterium]